MTGRHKRKHRGLFGKLRTAMPAAFICVLMMPQMLFPALAAPSSYYPPLDHRDAGIHEFQYTDLDLEGTEMICDRFYRELAAGSDMNKDQIVSDYQQLLQAFDLFVDLRH